MLASCAPCCQKSKGGIPMWLGYLFLSTCHVVVGGTWQETHIYRLERDLLSNYSPTVRPVLDVTSTINVSVTLYVMSIYEIDEMTQCMAQNSYMSFMWVDELLQWDPDQYGGLKSTELSSSKIWLPFTEVVNSVSGSWVISSGDVGKVIARATGHVTWVYQDVWKTLCPMDITYFPFDSQKCTFRVNMWTASISEVQFSEGHAAQDDTFIESAEWILQSLTPRVKEISFNNNTFSSFEVNFQVQRRIVFHTLTLIVPNVILALLASLVFILPAESGEKMSFIMGLLLTTGVHMTVLMDVMPSSSLNISYLMIYITSLSMTTAVAVVVSACILCCHTLEGLVGSKTTTLVFFLRKFTSKWAQLGRKRADNSRCEIVQMENCQEISQAADNRHKRLSTQEVNNSKGDESLSRTTSTEADQEMMSWKDVATILDQVCFRICITIVVGMTVLLIIVLYLGS